MIHAHIYSGVHNSFFVVSVFFSFFFQGRARFFSSGGIWNLLIALIAVECMMTPDIPRRYVKTWHGMMNSFCIHAASSTRMYSTELWLSFAWLYIREYSSTMVESVCVYVDIETRTSTLTFFTCCLLPVTGSRDGLIKVVTTSTYRALCFFGILCDPRSQVLRLPMERGTFLENS